MRLEIRHRLCLAHAQQSMCLQQVCHMSVALKPSAVLVHSVYTIGVHSRLVCMETLDVHTC